MSDRVKQALEWLAGEVSASDDEFRQAQHPGGAMLLEGMENNGFLNRGKGTNNDRVAVSARGFKRIGELS